MDDYHRPSRRERPSLEGGRGWSSSGSSGGGAGPGPAGNNNSGSGGGGSSVVGGGSGGGGGGARHRAGRHSSGGGRHHHHPHSECLLRSVLRRLGSAGGGGSGGGGFHSPLAANGRGYGPPSSPSAAVAAAATAKERRRRAVTAACALLALFLLMAGALYSVTGPSYASAGTSLAARLFGLQPRTEHARRIAAAHEATRAAAASGAPPPPGLCIPPERETPILAPSASAAALGAYSEVVAASGGALGADPNVTAPLLPPGPRGAPGVAATVSGRRRRRRLAAAAAAAPSQAPAGDDLPGPSSLDALQIALVNDVAFHHEVTLGLAAALAPRHASRLTVYVHARLFAEDDEEGAAAEQAQGGAGGTGGAGAGAGGARGAAKNGDASASSAASAAAAAALRAGQRRSSNNQNLGFLSYARAQLPGVTWQNAYHKPGVRPCDVVLFVSPEFNIDYTREFIALSRPRMSIMFFHEPRMELRRLRYMLGLHPFTGVAALAPHVARALHEHYPGGTLDVHWMYPTLAAPCSMAGSAEKNSAEKTDGGDDPDADDRGVPCREGFAVQGKFDGRRRNYKGLWKALGRYSTDLPAPKPARRRPTAAEDQDAAAARAAAAAVEAGLDPAAAVAAQVEEEDEQQTPARPLFINVVGSGRLSDLGLPPGLAAAPPLDGGGSGSSAAAAAAAAASSSSLSSPARAFGGVRVYRDLPYGEFYDTLCRSEALFPLFSREGGYLAHKISSSVGASLAAAVPMVVPGGRGKARDALSSGGGGGSSSSSATSSASSLLPSFLSIYSHFTPEAVVELREGETEVQVAARLLAAGGGDGRVLKEKRKALRALRGVLNRQAASKLDGLMSASLGKPRSSGSQPAPVKTG